MKEIIIEIKNGDIKTDFKGFEGKQCDIVANAIDNKLSEEGLKIDTKEKEYKIEYYMNEDVLNEKDMDFNENLNFNKF